MATVLPSRGRVVAETFALQMKRRRMIATAALVILLEQSLIGVSPFSNWSMSDADAQGDVLRQVIILGTLGIQLLAPGNARPPMRVPTSILVLLGYCLLSCTWAIEPSISLRRLAFTAAVVWILVRSLGDLGAVRTLHIVRVTLALLLAINFLVVMFSPYGKHMATVTEIEGVIGDWRGIMSHKNIAGAACAFTALFFVFDSGRIAAWLRASVIAGSVFFLYMSQSKTSMVMLAIALLAGGVMRFYNPRHRSILLPLGLVGVPMLLASVALYFGVVEAVLDDPQSLTGRGTVWPYLLDYASDHLWTGAGYESFWQIGPASPIWALTTDWVAHTAGHGHNGYLDMLVTIGLPGLLLTLVVLFVWPAVRLLCSLSIARSRRALFCAVMVFCAGHNLAESALFDRASTVHVFLLITIILIHRLSDQSAGAHQALRDKLVSLASREGVVQLRRRLAGRTRIPQVHSRRSLSGTVATERDQEDGIA